MINLTRVWESETNTYHLTIIGHAGTAPEGEDLVCAAASILAYTVLEYLRRETNADMKKQLVAPGDVHIIAEGVPEEAQDGLIALELGFELLEESFPDAIEVDEHNVRTMGD